MSLPPRIFLTGFMGCGKSTLGPILANVLGYGFDDLDALIEQRAGRSVQELFRVEGEAAFRGAEAGELRSLVGRKNLVVALGGGAFVQPVNQRLLLDNGCVVYLRLRPAALTERLLHLRTPRPLLQGADGGPLAPDELRERVAAMLVEREPAYLRAHVTVYVDDGSLGEAVDRLERAIRRWNPGPSNPARS